MRISTTRFPPGAELATHATNATYMSLVVTGSYTERVAGQEVECRPLALRFHSAGEEHAHVFGDRGGTCLNIELDAQWAESLSSLVTSQRPVHVESAGRVGVQVVERLRKGVLDECAFADSVVADLVALCEMQLGIDRARKNCTRRVLRAIEIIDDDPCGSLSLTGLAGAVDLHPTHLARSFRRKTGLTVGEYIRKRRRERAEALLLEQPARSISRVAAEAGFADHAHMTRTFRAELGVTPSQYRAVLAD